MGELYNDMTPEQIITELVSENEEVLFQDLPDLGAFAKPRPFGWRSILLTVLWSIPPSALFYYFEVFDVGYICSVMVAFYLTTIFMDWRAYKNITRNENYRNLIITDKRVIQISSILNFDNSLRLRYVDPSNFTGVEDKFADSIWWAAATTRDEDKLILIASRKTEKVKDLIRAQFLHEVKL